MAAPRKYRFIWEEVAKLEADHCKRWGLFDGYRGPVLFDAGAVRGAHLEHDPSRDEVTAFYTPEGSPAPVRETFSVQRVPAPRGGERVYFLAPCCGRRIVRLALLAEGVRCGPCGSITAFRRRHSKARRAVRSAERMGARLGCVAWYLPPPRRPSGMTAGQFLKLSEAHAAQVRKAIALLGPNVDLGGTNARSAAAVLAAI